MPNNYDPIQTVAPQTASPDNLLSVHASPESFGGQVGQAEQKAGAGGEQIGQQQMAIALQLQQMSNEQTANTHSMAFGDFTSQQETAFRQNRGQNAADAFPAFQASMQKQMADQAASIKSPMARNAFLQDARNFYNRSLYSAGSYVGDEVRQGVIASDAGKIQSFINNAASNYAVPGVTDQAIQDITDTRVHSDHNHQGIRDPDVINAHVQKDVGDLIHATAISMLNAGGPTVQGQAAALKNAQDFFHHYSDQTIPGSPGVPIIDATHKDNLGATLNYKEYTLSNRQDIETAHDVSDTVFNNLTVDYNQDLANHPLIKGSEEDRPVMADFAQSNIQKYVDQARQLGLTLSNGRHVTGDEAASLAETRIRTFITNENEHDKMSVNIVQGYILEGQNGKLPTSVRDLEQGPQQVQDAWKDILNRRPATAKAIIKSLLASNAGGKQLTYGTDFWNQFDRMTSRLGTANPPKAEDYHAQLGPTKDSPLTNTGMGIFSKEMAYAQSSPEGAAFVQSEKLYLEGLRHDIVGGLLIRNPNGERIFNQALQQLMPQIQAARQPTSEHPHGLTAGDLFDKDSPTYLGNANRWDGRDQNARVNAYVNNQFHTAPGGGTVGSMSPKEPSLVAPFDYKKADTVIDKAQVQKMFQDYAKSKTLQPAEVKQISDYLVKRGFIPSGPPASTPGVQ
jgi:hypothetical protein